MANDGRNDSGTDRTGPTGPDRQNVIDQLAKRNQSPEGAEYEASPGSDMTERAEADRTGTARRSEQAAGTNADEHNRRESREAYRDSRGDRGPRDQF